LPVMKVVDKIAERVEYRLSLVHFNGLRNMRMMAGHHVGAGVDSEMAHLCLVFRQLAGSPRGGWHAPAPRYHQHPPLLSRFPNILFKCRAVRPAIRNRVDDGRRARYMVHPKPGLVKSLNGIVGDASPVFCGWRRGRVAHRGAADESDLGSVALDDSGLACFDEVAAAASAHDASLIQDVQATQKRIQAVPCAWIVGEVHDIEACPNVGIEHP